MRDGDSAPRDERRWNEEGRRRRPLNEGKTGVGVREKEVFSRSNGWTMQRG